MPWPGKEFLYMKQNAFYHFKTIPIVYSETFFDIQKNS